MTVQEASNELFGWFETNDSFEIGRDLKKIVTIVDDEEATIIAYKIALEKLEEALLLCSKEYADKKYYVLEKHMDGFQQNIELGPWTAKYVATEINEFCEVLEDKTDTCQTSNIQEKDIRNLVHIIHWYKQRVLEKEQIISGTSSLATLLEESIPNDDDEDEGQEKNGNGKKKKK